MYISPLAEPHYSSGFPFILFGVGVGHMSSDLCLLLCPTL